MVNIKDLKNTTFIDILNNDHQKHISNFILSSGDEFKDDWPLSTQQRRRLLSTAPMIDLDARNQELQCLLKKYQILTEDQREDITIEPLKDKLVVRAPTSCCG